MKRTWSTRHRRWSWGIGLLVFAALGGAIYQVLRSDAQHRRNTRHNGDNPQAAAAANGGAAGPSLSLEPVEVARPRVGHTVGGIVLRPDGQPAGGVTVSLYRMLTAWPEWRRERIDQAAITGADGLFQFRGDAQQGLLLGFEHPDFAGGMAEVSLLQGSTQLQLQPAFELSGVVYNDSGLPVSNARVAIESVLSDQRRAQAVTTAANGRYRFTNLPAGPMRLVARHEAWQPAAVPAVVIGDQVRVDLRFERPTMAPLRGRVVSAVTQQPIVGALVELLPTNGKLGLIDPVTATSGEDGTFLIAGLSRGSIRVVVRHAEFGAVNRIESIGVLSTELVFEMPPRVTVTGQLVVDSGPALWYGGEVLRIHDEAGQVDRAVVAADGSFRFAASLSPGGGTLFVSGARFAFQRTSAAETSVRVDESADAMLELPVVAPTVVRGRLVDDAGAPLAGGVITQTKVLAENARSIRDAAAQLDLGAIGNQVVQLFGADRDEVLAVSATDGTFEVRGHKPGLVLVRVDLRGYGSRWLRLVVPSGSSTTELGDVVMPRGCRIQGRVLRGDRGLVGAAVTAVGVGIESQATVVVSASDGAFVIDDLLPGTYRVRARLPSQPNGSSEHEVRAAVDRRASDLILRLSVGRTVRGSVSGTDGQPLSGALVSVRGAVGQNTITDSSGEFMLELLDASERAIDLQVWFGDRSRQSIVPVLADQQQVAVRLDTPPTCTLLATVAGLPSKKRLSGALVRVASLDDGSDALTKTRWLDLQNGELRWSQCPVGRLRVQLWVEGYAPFSVDRELVANDVHNLGDLLLEPAGRLDGLVQDASGAPVANAFVCLGEETDLDLFEPRVRTGTDGSFRLSGVSSRSCRLIVRAAGFAPCGVDLQLPRDVLSGEPLVVQLERGTAIEVTVPATDAHEGGLVQLRRQGRLLASAELDEKGRAYFQNRSVGTYTVQLFGKDQPPKRVVVEPAMSVVRVRLP